MKSTVLKGFAIPPAGQLTVVIGSDGTWRVLNHSEFNGEAVDVQSGSLINRDELMKQNPDVCPYENSFDENKWGYSVSQIKNAPAAI